MRCVAWLKSIPGFWSKPICPKMHGRILSGVGRRLVSTLTTPELPPCRFEPDQCQPKLSRFEIEQIHRMNLNPCLKTLYRRPLLLTQGHMQYVWDDGKRRYLDMFGGIVTTSVGHCHPRLVATVSKHSRKLWHVSSLYLTEEMHEFASKLANRFPEPLRCLFLCNSGSEANDIAMTMARLHTKAYDIVALRNGYHGCTLSTMPLCGIGSWKFSLPTAFGVHHATTPDPYRGRVGGQHCRDSPVQTDRQCQCSSGDFCKASDYYIEELQTVLDSVIPKRSLAAMFAESIQGVGGVVQYPRTYIKRAHELVKERGGLMVMDEVQTGFGRCGTFFWEFQAHGILPDIVTMAKGIGNGFPLAAVITTSEIAQTLTQSNYFNTFGGNPLAAAVGSAVLDVMDEQNFQDRSQQLGTVLLEKLAHLRHQYGDIVGDVRGKGLMIGIEMVQNDQPMPAEHFEYLLDQCRDMGLILGRGGARGNVFRLTPPMCIDLADVEFTVQVMQRAFDNYHDWIAK